MASSYKPYLKYLFRPRAVAHVGASSNEFTGRFNFTKYLIEMKFEGSIYPVNPKYNEIAGIKCYPDLSSIPVNIDIAILAVPAENCHEVLKNIPAGKINFVVIHTSGFRELDKSELEDKLLEIARVKGFRIVGPNCMGIYSRQGRIGFWRDHCEAVKYAGTVGMVSQSGGHAINAIRGGISTGLHYDRVVSLGNQIDLSITEILENYSSDDDVRAIGIYVEQIGRGREFLQLLKNTTLRKPVVVWNGGVTKEGKGAAATHTGSIAGNADIFKSAMRQAGVISPTDRSEFLQLLRLLQPQFKLPCGNLAVISPGGGNTVSLCDMIASQPNLKLPLLSEKTREKLMAILPKENVDIKNPVDSGAAGIPMLEKILSAVVTDTGIESVLILLDCDFLSIYENDEMREQTVDSFSSTIIECMKTGGKAIHVLLIQHRQSHEIYDRYRRLLIDKFNQKNIAWIAEPFSNAAVIYSKLVWYRNYLESRHIINK